eukprot:XP_011680436.1 PREDICTED: apoptosis-enhancing nuclease-like [Strongylocentrotus purpuratus]
MRKANLRTFVVSSYQPQDTSMAKSTESKLKVTHKSTGTGKARKKKMALPRRIFRILESGKRVHFQNVSLSKKRQMCTNRYLPISDITVASGRDNLQKNPVMFHSESARGIVGKSEMTVYCESSNTHKPYSAKNEKPTTSKDRGNRHREVVAIDCEMVGLGPKGRFTALARCSIIHHSGEIIYDSYVKPDEPITDYRTKWSGIRPRNMVNAIPFNEAQEQVKNLLKDKIVIGHAVWNDFQALKFSHPPNDVRDTSKCKLLAEIYGSKCTPGQHLGLKSLAKYLLGIDVQRGEHSSVEDARAAMDLYKLVEDKWEEELQSTFPDQDFRTSFLDDHFWPEDLI